MLPQKRGAENSLKMYQSWNKLQAPALSCGCARMTIYSRHTTSCAA
jgi:hypothetical protein